MANRVGQQVGQYRLLRLLGEGGFAEVYRGEHVHLGTLAAIKLLSAKLSAEEIERFRQEARTIARLRHPHIVRVLDFGVEGSVPYLVMDYAEGGTLRTLHPKGTQLSPEAIVPYVQQVASALQYAHDQKLIHRDVKPENMLLVESGEVLLSDFGIAIVSQSSRYQSTQDTAGTIAYMAPEQIQAHPRPASDQYSLGIVVYEWLTGERPFTGSMGEVLAKQISVPPPPLCEKRPDLSPELEQVVLTALEKDPKARFASVQAFATALTQASQMSQPPLVRPAPALPPTLPAAAPPVTTPPKRSAWEEPTPAGEPPVTSGPFAPTQRTPPQAEEPTPRVRRTPPPPAALPLTPTERAAAPSTVPALVPGRSRAKPWWVRGLLVGLVVLVVVGGSVVGPKLAGKGSPTPAGNTSNGGTPSITEFAVPIANSDPEGIVAGPDGNLWFTEYQSSKIGRITPSGTITEFALPNANSQPRGIATGPDGNLWFTEYGSNQIGRITPSGTITQFALPNPCFNSSFCIAGPWGIIAGPDGNLWFTDPGGDQIGRITPGGRVTEFALPTPSSNSGGGYGNAPGGNNTASGGITTGPDGNLWFPEAGGDQIGRITPSGTITQFALPTANSDPVEITLGPDGNLWFTETDGNQIGRITPEGRVTEFALPNDGSNPGAITAGPDGNLWFIEAPYRGSDQIGRITPSGTITEFALPSATSDSGDITAGPDGNLWFTEVGSNRIGRISPGP